MGSQDPEDSRNCDCEIRNRCCRLQVGALEREARGVWVWVWHGEVQAAFTIIPPLALGVLFVILGDGNNSNNNGNGNSSVPLLSFVLLAVTTRLV